MRQEDGVFVAVIDGGIKLGPNGLHIPTLRDNRYYIVTSMWKNKSCSKVVASASKIGSRYNHCHISPYLSVRGERVSTSLLRILKKFLIMMRNEATEVRLYLSDTTPASKCRVEWSAESDRSNETNPIETFFLSRVCFASSAARGSILRPDKL
jgi:hypothetical protein